MSSTQLDKVIAKKESDAKRNKLKSGRPTDGRWVDGLEKMRTQGKGDKNRDLRGWMSQEVTDRLKEIFGGKEKKEKKATDKATNEEKTG